MKARRREDKLSRSSVKTPEIRTFRQRRDDLCETPCSTIITAFHTISLRSRSRYGLFFWLPQTSVQAYAGLWTMQLLLRLAELTARSHHKLVRAWRRPCREPMRKTSILLCNTDQTQCAMTPWLWNFHSRFWRNKLKVTAKGIAGTP